MALAQYQDTWWLPSGKLASCALVKVFPVDSNIPACLYADSCGSQKLPNPLRTSDRGVLTFWAEEGKYWIHIDGRTYPLTVGADQCTTQQDINHAMSDHVQAGDPHGDRAAAESRLMHHDATTKAVHGITDTSLLETKDGAQIKANRAVEAATMLARQNVDEHAARTQNVHGICNTATLETIEGAQDKANRAVEAAGLLADQKVSDHAARTRDVHGIPDTSKLATTDNVKPLVEEAARPAAERAAKEAVSSALGGVDPAQLETKDSAQAKADAARDEAIKTAAEDAAQKADTARKAAEEAAAKCCEETRKSAEAGDAELQKRIDALQPGGDTSQLETKDGAQAKADKARDEAKAAAEECCTKNADAIKAGDDALQKQIDDLKKGQDGGPRPGTWETPDGAQKKAGKALTDAKAYTDDALKKHVDSCHTLKLVTGEGVTPETGWEVDLAELRSIGGVHTAFLRLKRTGDHIYSEGPDFTSEGLPSQGNIVPDMLIATLDEAWRPPQTYLVSAHTSYTSGSVRVHPNGEVYLLDVTYNNPVRTGHTLRFEYDFLTRTPCEQDGDGGSTPPDGGGGEQPSGGLTRKDVEGIVSGRLAQYPNAHADNFDNVSLKSRDWVTLKPEVKVTIKVPPSRRVQVSTCMTARNNLPLIQTYQAVRITKSDQVLLKPSDSRAVTLAADQAEEASSACHTMIVDFAKLAGGAAKAGDEVTFTVQNRRSKDTSDAESGTSTVLDRNVSVASLITPVPESATVPAPRDGGETPAPAPGSGAGGGGLSREQLAEALRAYPSGFAHSSTPVSSAAQVWASLESPVSVRLVVPPSRRVRVTHAMRASNSLSGLSQAHQAVEIIKARKVVAAAGTFPIITLSHIRLNETDAASRTFHIDFAELAGGAVHAGEEVEFVVRNRVTLGTVQVLDRDVSVESLLA